MCHALCWAPVVQLQETVLIGDADKEKRTMSVYYGVACWGKDIFSMQ